MHSLKAKVVELQTELKRNRQRTQDAAANRIMASLRASFGVDLEAGIHALSGRLLTNDLNDADQRVLAMMPEADLHELGTTAARQIILLDTVFQMY